MPAVLSANMIPNFLVSVLKKVRSAARNTLVYTLLNVGVGMVLELLLALFLYKNTHINRFL